MSECEKSRVRVRVFWRYVLDGIGGEREREAFGEEFGLDGLEELDAGLERERERERGGLECSRGPVGLERK